MGFWSHVPISVDVDRLESISCYMIHKIWWAYIFIFAYLWRFSIWYILYFLLFCPGLILFAVSFSGFCSPPFNYGVWNTSGRFVWGLKRITCYIMCVMCLRETEIDGCFLHVLVRWAAPVPHVTHGEVCCWGLVTNPADDVQWFVWARLVWVGACWAVSCRHCAVHPFTSLFTSHVKLFDMPSGCVIYVIEYT